MGDVWTSRLAVWQVLRDPGKLAVIIAAAVATFGETVAARGAVAEVAALASRCDVGEGEVQDGTIGVVGVFGVDVAVVFASGTLGERGGCWGGSCGRGGGGGGGGGRRLRGCGACYGGWARGLQSSRQTKIKIMSFSILPLAREKRSHTVVFELVNKQEHAVDTAVGFSVQTLVYATVVVLSIANQSLSLRQKSIYLRS